MRGRVLPHASPFELGLVALAVLAVAVVVRNVVRRRLAGDDLGEAVRVTLQRGARTGGLVGGGFVAFAVSAVAFGFAQILVLVAVFAALGGDDDSVGGWVLLALGASFLFAVLAIWLFVRAARRFWRNRRAVRATTDEPRRRTLVGDLSVCIAVLASTGAYVAIFVAQPAWVGEPTCDRDTSIVEDPTPTTRVLPVRSSAHDVAAQYDIEPLPLFSGGEPQEVHAIERSDGGVTISAVGGSYRTISSLRSDAESLLNQRGWKINGRSSSSGSLTNDSFSVQFIAPSYEGSIRAVECSGYRKPAVVSVTAVIPPQRAGACAPQPRRPICDVLRSAAEAVGFDDVPIVERADGALMIDVAKPREIFIGIFAGSEAEDYARGLVGLGWSTTIDPPDDTFAHEVTITATRDGGAYRATVVVSGRGDLSVTGRIDTRDPAPR